MYHPLDLTEDEKIQFAIDYIESINPAYQIIPPKSKLDKDLAFLRSKGYEIMYNMFPHKKYSTINNVQEEYDKIKE